VSDLPEVHFIPSECAMRDHGTATKLLSKHSKERTNDIRERINKNNFLLRMVSSGMLRRVVPTRTTRRNIQENTILHSHRREKLKFYNFLLNEYLAAWKMIRILLY
jgi:hypothetical protein